MEPIRIYPDNSPELNKLKLACYELERLSKRGTVYTVENIYFDVGQNWKYSAIVANRPDGRSWHAVCPRDYERILYADDVAKTCADIVADKYFYDP